MQLKKNARILSALLAAALVALTPAASVSAAGRLLKPVDEAGYEEPDDRTGSGSASVSSGANISVKLLKQVARDYDIDPDFLDEIDGKKSIRQSTLKSYAREYGLPAQYVQRFFDDCFVFKTGNTLEYIPIESGIPKNHIDWNSLTRRSNGELRYGNARKGIDVSEFQGTINWDQVKASGVDFAFIRVGYRGYGTGKLNYDSRYQQNIEGALDAGIDVGVYFYSQAVNRSEALEEARMLLDAIDGYDITYPVVLDIEGAPSASARTSRLTPRTTTQIVDAFCGAVEDAGYTPMVYSYTKWFIEKMDLAAISEYDVWLAQYYKVPFYPYKLDILQYSSTGRVNGISGNVDMNIAFTRN